MIWAVSLQVQVLILLRKDDWKHYKSDGYMPKSPLRTLELPTLGASDPHCPMSHEPPSTDPTKTPPSS